MTTAASRAANRVREVIGSARRDCPLCGSLHLQYQILIDKFPVCACQSCGLAFLNPQPETDSSVQSGSGAARAVEDAEITKRRFAELKAYTGLQNGLLLLIADDDGLTSVARQQGFETQFLSISDINAGVKLPDNLDVCVVYNALEKTLDPFDCLRALRRALSPEGAVLVISPAADSLHDNFSQVRSRDLNRETRFYFSVDTLQSLLIKAGFGDPVIGGDDRLAGLAGSPSPSATTTSFLVRPKTQSATPLLSVIVPVYNEQRTFPSMMDQLLAKTLDGVNIEIILIESNSTDGSREQVLKYAHHPRVKMILEPAPRGKGHAVRAGLRIARGDIVLFQDADLEYDLNDYDALIEPLVRLEANFVLGSRHSATKSLWKMRRFTDSAALAAYFNLGHVLFLWLFNVTYRQKLTDPFTMYKVFRRDCLYGLQFVCDRFDFDNEIVIKLVRKGYKPLELPVNYVSRSFQEGKKVTLFGDAFRWLITLFRFRRTPLYPGL